MIKNDTIVEVFESAMNAWCGPEERRRLEAVVGGAATGELIKKLQASDNVQRYAVCCQHAKERAEDISWFLKPGDLFYRSGEYLWGMYCGEIRDALRALSAGRYRQNKAIVLARVAFIETVERIRILRIGTPEERKVKAEAGFPGIEFSETFQEYCKREREHAIIAKEDEKLEQSPKA